MADWNAFLDTTDPDRCISQGNRVEHFTHDDRTVRALWNAIEDAQDFIWISMYIFEPDEVGRETIERLADACRRGCTVLLLYDQQGSFRLKGKHLAPLETDHAEVAIFNRFWPPWAKQGQLSIRNHRKLVLVDGTTAFCGGMNLSEEFAGNDFGEWVFDDTMVRIEGPCVHHLADVFMRTWHETTGDEHPLPPPMDPLEDGVPLEVLETDPRRPQTKLRSAISSAVAQAEERCYLTSPYFVPPSWLVESLIEAAERGADVRVLTAGDTDTRIARAAARHEYGTLFDHGIRIYEHKIRVLHSKTLTIDGVFGLVGSYNMDRWTSRHTLDLSVASVDTDLAAALEAEFLENLKGSHEVSPEAWRERNWATRVKQRVAFTLVANL